MKNSKPSKSRSPAPVSIPFPPAWPWFTDEVIPQWVKTNYSPRDSWKDKPFSKEDARFFFKGIDELSRLFTEERPRGMPPYFQHPKYRSSYLLYFLPLQMAKFLTLFQQHPGAIEAALHHGSQTGALRIADLGSGPGTASLSFLLTLLNFPLKTGQTLPPIELYWFDTNKDIMDDGKALAEQISSQFPRLRGKLTVKTYVLPWWKAPSELPDQLSLSFVGHVLNESSSPQKDSDPFWQELLKRTSGGGTLMIEPATRKSGQILAQLRDHFFEAEWIEKDQTQIWGPCLHAGACPLAQGRDWCHFSFPTHIPGQWFKNFSENLGSERHWVKFSYLWLASQDYPSLKVGPQFRRVISDPLSQTQQGAKSTTVLICEPETAGRHPAPARAAPKRGDIIRVDR